MSKRDRCPRTSCLCFSFCFVFSLSLSPPAFCISSIQLTPPHCNFCVTHFANTLLESTVGCKVTAWSVMFVSLHFIWSESGSFSCTLDSCSLYCLTSFFPPHTVPGALAAVISMFSFKSPWTGGRGGWVRGHKMGAWDWKLILTVMGYPLSAAREAQETGILCGWKWQISRDQNSGVDCDQAISQVSCQELLQCDAISLRTADYALTYGLGGALCVFIIPTEMRVVYAAFSDYTSK